MKGSALVGILLVASGCASAPRTDAAKGYVAEGLSAEKRGDHAAAVTLYTRAIEADPKYADAWFERGYSNVQLRRSPDAAGNTREYVDRALLDYSQAISLDPSRGDAYYDRAMIYAERALYREAAEDLLNAIKFKPQDPDPHLKLAKIYESKFDDMGMKAGEHYEKYADLGGRDPEARERARQFKEFRKKLESSSAPALKAPTEEDEKKAQEIHVRMMALLKEDKKAEAVKLAEELLSTYGRTKYVQGILPGLKVIVNAFKEPKEPPK